MYSLETLIFMILTLVISPRNSLKLISKKYCKHWPVFLNSLQTASHFDLQENFLWISPLWLPTVQRYCYRCLI